MVQTESRESIDNAASDKKVRVLVVDDSAVYRRALRDVLAQIPCVEVVGASSDGRLALQQIESLKPDLITLDLEMPDMNGIDVLRSLSRLNSPVRAIMVSSHTEVGANATIEALQEGAFDFIVKPACASMEDAALQLKEALSTHVSAFIHNSRPHGAPKVLSAAPVCAPPLPAKAAVVNEHWICEGIGIGVSTGGPEALRQVIPALSPEITVPIYIVQHMPPIFTKSLASSLNSLSPLPVEEAEHGTWARPGRIYLAPGGQQMKVTRVSGKATIQITSDPPENSCQPSVDYLFRSMARVYRGNCLAVIMTGMGSDGAEGCRLLHKLGARIIAQDAATCVVFGMPRLPIQEGLAHEILPLGAIAGTVSTLAEGVRSA